MTTTIERHDESLLWAYAAQELELGEARVVEDHLDLCPECRETLASVQVAREALEAAREARPLVRWQAVDEAVGKLVERKLAAKTMRALPLRALFGVGVVMAAAGLALVLARGEPRPAPVAPVAPALAVVDPPPPPALPATARVDRSLGLERSGQRDVPDGTVLAVGDVLKTSASGKAFVHLPDLSHVRLAGGSSLTLSRAAADDVALTLQRGRVAVRASHQDRKGFVVYAGGLAVHVVGTVFAVTEAADGTDVAVSEGRVRVELPSDETEFVDAGERLHVDPRGRLTRGLKLTQLLGRELDEVQTVGDAASAVETNAVVAAAGGRTSQPPLLAAQGAPRTLPRLSSAEAHARQVALPAEATDPAAEARAPAPSPNALRPTTSSAEAVATQRLEPATEVSVELTPASQLDPQRRAEPTSAADEWAAPPAKPAPRPTATPTPADEWVTMGAAPSPASAPVDERLALAAPPTRTAAAAPEPASAPSPADEWTALPQPAPAPPAPAVAPTRPEARLREDDTPPPQGQVTTATPRPMARDLETLFMNRATAALQNGTCSKYLVGLEDIAQDATRTSRTELARALRARCFAAELRPRQALSEYRKYLEEYPRGRFVAEAADALGQ